MKRRLKQEQKLKEKEEKEKNKPKEDSTKPKAAVKDEDISPNEYFKLRSTAVQTMVETNQVPYPHKYHVDISLQDFIDKFTHLTNSQALDTELFSIAGRINAIRIWVEASFLRFER
jgi:lysyl-tRNA synthetase class 2